MCGSIGHWALWGRCLATNEKNLKYLRGTEYHWSDNNWATVVTKKGTYGIVSNKWLLLWQKGKWLILCKRLSGLFGQSGRMGENHSIHPPISPQSIQPGLWTSQIGLRANWRGLRANKLALRAYQPGLNASQTSEPADRASQPLDWFAFEWQIGFCPEWITQSQRKDLQFRQMYPYHRISGLE